MPETWYPAEWLESIVAGRGAGDHAHVLTDYGLQHEDDFKLLKDEDVEEIHGNLRAAGMAPLHAKAICRAIDAKRQSVDAGQAPITVTSPRAASALGTGISDDASGTPSTVSKSKRGRSAVERGASRRKQKIADEGKDNAEDDALDDDADSNEDHDPDYEDDEEEDDDCDNDTCAAAAKRGTRRKGVTSRPRHRKGQASLQKAAKAAVEGRAPMLSMHERKMSRAR